MSDLLLAVKTPVFSAFTQCKSKSRFPTAERALEACHKAVRMNHASFTVYECPYCNTYHVGKVWESDREDGEGKF